MIHLYFKYVLFGFICVERCFGGGTNNSHISVVTIIEEFDKNFVTIIDDVFADIILPNGTNVTHFPIIFQEGDEFPAYLQICDRLLEGISILVDLTWEGWIHARSMAESLNMPYVHLDVTLQQFVRASDDFLRYRNATDAALVFHDENDLDQGLLYLVGNTIIRIIVVEGMKNNATDNLRQMKPVPSQFVMYGTKKQLTELLERVNKSELLARDTIWTIVSLDFEPLTLTGIQSTLSVIKPSKAMCASVQGKVGNYTDVGNVTCEDSTIKEMFVKTAFESFKKIFLDMLDTSNDIVFTVANCSNYTGPYNTSAENSDKAKFERYALETFKEMPYVNYNNSKMVWDITMDVLMINTSGTHVIGKWTTDQRFINLAGDNDELVKRFFRVGTMIQIPFVYKKLDSHGNTVKNEHGEEILEGFCMELLEKLSKEMKFNYRIRIPPDEKFGNKKSDGSWDGLIGDLVNGDTDMIVAPLTITSEREEVIDFVAPYFEQSGISIVMRRPEKQTSLFKFMSVLKEEVWWCILAALVVTALVLFVVDRFSPYSGRNKELYPYKCREFSLSECFWFALTSMTPQGGGEPPKAVSGRILVAAYWIFVVLMLATFTANLAAFLTVERMQSPVNSMEELSKQSKINYSVVNGTTIHDYFTNMAAAEEELYRVWKDMTLNSSNEQSKFRVWDYPIKEQFSRILSVIEGTGLLQSAEEGFEKVNNDLDRKFAFIHDASTLKYAVFHNCNLTEVGEPFAEQPYAIAVQSGSHLQDEIGKHLLELQKDRYFETLSQRYWNSSLRKECPNNDDSEGITLDSIGGVFIATLVGLVVGMLTLVGEIIFYKRQKKSKVVAIQIKPKLGMEK